LAEGTSIRAYDPEALTEACQMIPELQPCRDTYHAAEGADALVIMTEWNVFRNLDFEKLKSVMRVPMLLDLRNVYDPERVAAAGFKHISVGRMAQSPKSTR
jgi:UDPglucose 6-dehydrogenase